MEPQLEHNCGTWTRDRLLCHGEWKWKVNSTKLWVRRNGPLWRDLRGTRRYSGNFCIRIWRQYVSLFASLAAIVSLLLTSEEKFLPKFFNGICFHYCERRFLIRSLNSTCKTNLGWTSDTLNLCWKLCNCRTVIGTQPVVSPFILMSIINYNSM